MLHVPGTNHFFFLPSLFRESCEPGKGYDVRRALLKGCEKHAASSLAGAMREDATTIYVRITAEKFWCKI